MFLGAPTWVWITTLCMMGPVFAGLALAFLYEVKRAKPIRVIEVEGVRFELWVRERKFPCAADAIIVPAARDLKLVAGIAKWVRDATANKLQDEADRLAPLDPGQAFVGSGGRYKFDHAVVAVVMDDQKTAKPEWIRAGVRAAMKEAQLAGASSCILPDFTDDLMRQPQWPSAEQRRETCRPIAVALLEGAMSSYTGIDTVVVWVWRADMRDIYEEEFERLAAASKAAKAA